MTKSNNMGYLQKIYSKGRLVPFVGAGLSVPFKIPSWKELIEELSSNLPISLLQDIHFELDNKNYWNAIDLLMSKGNYDERQIQEEIVRLIREKQVRSPNEEDHNYGDIGRLNFPRILTTNYDNWLFEYLEGDRLLPQVLSNSSVSAHELTLDDSTKRIWHLHGNISDTGSLVFTRKKYNHIYSEEKYRRLFSLLSGSYVFLFLGFSFNDEYVKQLIQDYNEYFQARHFILLENPTATLIAELKEKYRLDVLTYDIKNSSHSKEIRKFLYEISNSSQSSFHLKDVKEITIEEKTQKYFKELFDKEMFLEKIKDSVSLKLKDIYVLQNYKFSFLKDYDNYASNYNVLELIKTFSNIKSDDGFKEITRPNALFIFGHPGVGKSSLVAKIVDDNFANDHKKIICIRLREFEEVTERNPVKDIIRYLDEITNTKNNVEYLRNRIIIMDGLDELCAIQGLTEEDTKRYCDNLIQEISGLGSKVIITSRFHTINIHDYTKLEALIIELLPFDLEHRKLWLEQYKMKSISKINPEMEKSIYEINDKHKEELLGIPLFLYMIVSLNIKISLNLSLGKLFDEVFRELKIRHYNYANRTKKEQQHYEKTKELAQIYAHTMFKKNTFILKSDEAREAWYDFKNKVLDGDHVVSNPIDIEEELERYYTMSFYYRQIRSDRMAVEFVHRTIQAYLMANKVWKNIRDAVRKNINIESLSDLLKELFYNVKLSSEIIDFFGSRIIEHEDGVSKELHESEVALIREYLQSMFVELLNTDLFLLQSNINNERFGEPQRNMFYSYWSILKAFFKDTNALLEEAKIPFAKLVSDLSKLGNLTMDLSYVDLSNTKLPGAKLRGSNFTNAILNSVDFRSDNDIDTDLSKCIFVNAKLKKADLSESCLLNDVDFTSADLTGINLIYAVGDHIIFEETILDGAALNMANFKNANWKNTRLSNKVSISLDQIPMFLDEGIDITQFDIRNDDFYPATKEEIEQAIKQYYKVREIERKLEKYRNEIQGK